MDKAEDKAANRNDLLKIISGRGDKELNSSYSCLSLVMALLVNVSCCLDITNALIFLNQCSVLARHQFTGKELSKQLRHAVLGFFDG